MTATSNGMSRRRRGASMNNSAWIGVEPHSAASDGGRDNDVVGRPQAPASRRPRIDKRAPILGGCLLAAVTLLWSGTVMSEERPAPRRRLAGSLRQEPQWITGPRLL